MASIFFTKELLKDWDGRLVLLTYTGLACAVYDYKDDEKGTHFSMMDSIDQCIKDHPAAYDFTLDWKEYINSEGAGKTFTWKTGKYVKGA